MSLKCLNTHENCPLLNMGLVDKVGVDIDGESIYAYPVLIKDPIQPYREYAAGPVHG